MSLRVFPFPDARGLAVIGLVGLFASLGYADNAMPPVGGVEVLVENVIDGRVSATTTEESGRFLLAGLPPGEYRLIIGIARRVGSTRLAKSTSESTQPIGYDVRLSVYGGAMTAQWVPASSPKVRVGIVFSVPIKANGTIAGTIKAAAPPSVQTQITWPVPPSFTY